MKMQKYGHGWFKESYRHYLAAKGIRTGRKMTFYAHDYVEFKEKGRKYTVPTKNNKRLADEKEGWYKEVARIEKAPLVSLKRRYDVEDITEYDKSLKGAKGKRYMQEKKTILSWLKEIASKDVSTEEDSASMQNFLRMSGMYPNAVVVVGVVYPEGSGPPTDIHTMARTIVDVYEKEMAKRKQAKGE